MTGARKRAALEVLSEALWEIDTEDDPMVVVAELVDAAFVEEEAELDRHR